MSDYNNLIEAKIEIINNKIGNSNSNDKPIDSYKKFKSKISKSDICKSLAINEQMLNGFETTLFAFEKHKENQSVKKIAFLRLANWLNTINKTSGLDTKIDIDKINSQENTAIKQVRAIELVLRDLIYDQHDGKEGITSKLNEFFKSEIVQKWIQSADETGVLSGTTFNELSALFLDKRLFQAYDNIFDQSSSLKYDKKKTSSLRYFLDDIRIIRNSIAHNKKISPVQIELLNEYYNEISNNINKAFEEGKTKVNTGVYLDISEEDLNKYMSSVKEDMNEIKDGLDDLSKKVDEGFNKVLDDTKEIKSDTKQTKSSLKYILGGIGLIITLALIIIYFVGGQSQKTDEIADKIDNSSSEINKNIKEVKDIVSGDAELKNMSNSSDLTVTKELNERTKHVDAKKIAIVYFDNTGDEKKLDKLKKGLAGMLISDLSNIHMLDIVERDRLEEILKEQKLQKSESFDSNTAAEVGKLLGAEIILTGAYFEMFGSFRIDARFIDVETGEILKSEGVDGASDNFFKLEKQLAWKIIKNLDIKLSDNENQSLKNAESEQNISYELSLLYSEALEDIDNKDYDNAVIKLEKIVAKSPNFKPAQNELDKINKFS